MANTDFGKQIFDASVYVESYEIKLEYLQIEQDQLSKQISELHEKIAFCRKQIKAFSGFKKQFEAMSDGDEALFDLAMKQIAI